MTDIQNDNSRHYHAHNHTHAEQTKELHSTNFVIFFLILIFSALRGGSRFLKNIITSPIFRSKCI